MPRSSRRSRTRGQTAAESASDEVPAAAPSSTSGRRSARGSARSSAKKKSRRGGKRGLSPEEQAAKQQQQQALIKGGVIVAILVAAVVGGVIAFKPDPAVEAAKSELVSVSTDLEQLDMLLRRNPAAALEQVEELRSALDVQRFAQVDPAFGTRVEGMREQLQELETEARQLQNRAQAEARLAALQKRLESLAKETDLAGLGQAIASYRINPVSDQGMPPPDLDRYSDLIGKLEDAEAAIEAERARRSDTSSLESSARLAVSGLIQQERFAQAAEKLAELQQEHPTVDWSALATHVQESTERAWQSIQDQVAAKMAVAGSSGLSAEDRAAERRAAEQLLDDAGRRFPDSYADRIQDLRRQHQL